ncbi:hypothetical protein BCEN4_1140019 [Burkholderia cenocepacia]|nr:hypothetical protein BCEN4_1140019 [Burkholderia cenocepacia]
MGEARRNRRRGPEAGNHAAARQRPLLPRSRAGRVSGTDALLADGRRHPEDLRGLVARNHPSHGRERRRHHRAAADVGRRGRPARERPGCRAAVVRAVQRAGARSPRGARMAQELHADAGDRCDQRRDCRVRVAGRREARHAGHDELTLTQLRMYMWQRDERGLATPFIFSYRIDEIYQIQIIDRYK